MSDFTVITTQEEFDAKIGERLKRERDSLAKKYSEDYVSKDEHAKALDDLQKKLDAALNDGTHNKELIEELNKKVQEYETNSVKMKIAQEIGLPLELVDRLRGDDEDALRNDAASLVGLFGQKSQAPAASSEPKANYSGEEAAYRQLLNSLK